ncbi:hypothetical protein L226DRAFT_617362 [Lentinus tigrinus ALCF2SS1-7]|uniref:uncharacterized protein n=1 Tax=Lentinus tigrinus ALCF2SS1-7 TaxID=1328758 RepID=UPI001165F9DF|nr:hypothetical protein L226DRAFT_617362 [Lentinus tigrinus ALCF2SS1-7]
MSLNYHAPEDLYPEACLDPTLPSKTPQEVIKDYFNNVTQNPDKDQILFLRARLSRVPGGEQWTNQKLRQYFRRNRKNRERWEERSQRREHVVGEQPVSQLPRTPHPYERCPKSLVSAPGDFEANPERIETVVQTEPCKDAIRAAPAPAAICPVSQPCEVLDTSTQLRANESA